MIFKWGLKLRCVRNYIIIFIIQTASRQIVNRYINTNYGIEISISSIIFQLILEHMFEREQKLEIGLTVNGLFIRAVKILLEKI